MSNDALKNAITQRLNHHDHTGDNDELATRAAEVDRVPVCKEALQEALRNTITSVLNEHNLRLSDNALAQNLSTATLTIATLAEIIGTIIGQHDPDMTQGLAAVMTNNYVYGLAVGVGTGGGLLSIAPKGNA